MRTVEMDYADYYESPALTAELQARLIEEEMRTSPNPWSKCLVRRRGGNFYAAAEEAGKVVRKGF